MSQKLQFRVSDEDAELIKRYAERDDRTVSEYVRFVLMKEINSLERARQFLEENGRPVR